ncbi:SIMPL domain-containing protein [Massilia sp. CF038]|uniref:SIMPL domain-containing protein n=1 Tax=Massilia sp. CF038 TaxID=1881045 RepID=UPI0009201D0F|nr:SIMPL domain-containing protein [Massilia sp. CF038]SHG68754.1 Uncharacterized conserved protein YggE, contains kinase-interacting SIMPL domain [Massilia sp. CF038]
MFKLVLFALFCAMPAAAALAADLPAYPFIHADGVGSATVLPDQGEIDFEIAARDADPALAVAQVQARVAEIRALMDENGIGPDDVEVRDLRKEIVKDGSAEAPSYEIRCGVKLIVRNLAKWRAVVGPLLDKPNLDGFMTVFDTAERARVEGDLMREAVAAARRKAEAMAAAAGRKLGPVSAISSGEMKNLSRAMNLAPGDFGRYSGSKSEPASRADLLAVTLLKMAQPVSVIYRLR